MFHDAMNIYVKVGAKEVLKDFKRCYLLKKTMAHRQMVLMRTVKKEKKKAKISLEEFSKDRSMHKQETHSRLKASILQFGDAFLWSVYTVRELKKLCLAADVNIPKKTTRKIEIAKLLLPVMKEGHSFLYSFYLDNLQTNMVDMQEESNDNDNGPLRIRIRAVRS